jgi:hypothetical protein
LCEGGWQWYTLSLFACRFPGGLAVVHVIAVRLPFSRGVGSGTRYRCSPAVFQGGWQWYTLSLFACRFPRGVMQWYSLLLWATASKVLASDARHCCLSPHQGGYAVVLVTAVGHRFQGAGQ